MRKPSGFPRPQRGSPRAVISLILEFKMKKFLLCAALLCSAAFASAQAPPDRTDRTKGDKADMSNALDGTWTIVCIEKKGEPMKDAKDMTVVVKDNTIMCSGKDGKPAMSMKFEFTKPGHAKVTVEETAGATDPDRQQVKASEAKTEAKTDAKTGTKAAVYVLTKDYLAVCIHDEPTTDREGKDNEVSGDEGKITTSKPSNMSNCSIVLKRSNERK